MKYPTLVVEVNSASPPSSTVPPWVDVTESQFRVRAVWEGVSYPLYEGPLVGLPIKRQA